MFKSIKKLFINSKTPKKRELVNIKNRLHNMIFDLPVRDEWLSDEEIGKIERDPTVLSTKANRKSATLKREFIVNSENEKIKSEFEKIFDYEIISQILDTPLQGMSVFEINWYEKESYLFPKLIERDYREFTIHQRELYFLHMGTPINIKNVEGGEYKAVYGLYENKFNRQDGKPLYNTLFWLMKFKFASVEFWMEFLQRFGNPWVIAKSDGEKESFADNLYAMLSGGVAVIESDESVELKNATGKGEFKEVVEYIDNQITRVFLGANLAGEVKGGSYSASQTHADIREDIAIADSNIVQSIINQVIDKFKSLNNFNGDLEIYLKDLDNPNIELAGRDKIIFEMGYKPTKEYIAKTYNIDITEVNTTQAINSKNLLFPNALKFQDTLDYQSSKNKPKNAQKEILNDLEYLLSNSKSFEEFEAKLSDIYSNNNTSEFEEELIKQLINSQILGRAEIEDETRQD